MAAEGYDLTPPATVEDLRAAILSGNATSYGQPANVAATVPAAEIVARSRWLRDTEAAWGPAPGRAQSDGRGVHVLGRQFGNVFVGLQPMFGYEGDPMRLLFEKGFAPTHAFTTFYRWLREDFGADASTAGCARISGQMPCCISGCTAHWNSCRASRPASAKVAGPTG